MIIFMGYMYIVLEMFIGYIEGLVLGFRLNDEGFDVGNSGSMAFC